MAGMAGRGTVGQSKIRFGLAGQGITNFEKQITN
jgi:hypothetical protein